MGLQYSKLKELNKPSTSSIIHNSLSKIRDYHGAFKSICDTFAISIVEYEQIFGNPDAFYLWDSDKNGVIDALEMFTGLILFSDARAEDKLKAMFELYDFNEIRSISKTDLEFLLYCCISASLKVYGYADEYPQDKPIHDLVATSLSKSSRVSLNDLLHFCAFSEEISQFLYFFKIKGLNLPKPLKKQDVFEPLREKTVFPAEISMTDSMINKKIDTSSKAWISAVYSPLSNGAESQSVTGKFSLHWVLGIHAENLKHNISVVPGNDIIIYFISTVVVLLYRRLLKQKHYLEHTNEVSSICIGKEIACTGEFGSSPKIHIWRITTLETLQILYGVHQSSICLIGLTNNDQHLVTCSKFTVVIYDWRINNILVTTNHFYPIVDLYLLPRMSAKTCFIVSCDEEFTVYSSDQERLNMNSVNIEVSMCKSPICCVTGQGIYDLKNENSFFLLTGHEDGSVLLWDGIEFLRIVVTYESSISSMQVIVNWYAIAAGLGLIYIWESKLETCEKVIELSMFTFKLLSFEITSLKYINKKLYISTKGGDIIEARIQLDNLKIAAKRIGGIIQIPAGQTSITFLSVELPFLIVGGRNGVLTSIDLRSYEIIDTWAVGYTVNCIRCEKFGDTILLAAGCEEGRLFIRENWDLIFQPEAGKDNITDLEFVKSGKFLIVASEDKNLYVFKKGANFEKVFLISIETGVPVSLTVSKNKDNVLVVTDKRKLMMMDTDTFELNFTFEDVAGVEWNRLHTFFYASVKERFFKVPVVWNKKGDCVVAGGSEGVRVWHQASKVNDEAGYLLNGHFGRVLDLALKSNLMFTLGEDRMATYWMFEKVTVNIDTTDSEIPDSLKQEKVYSLEKPLSSPPDKNEQFLQTAFLTSVQESSGYFFSTDQSSKPALISVNLQFIYGAKTNLRNSLLYIHNHTSSDPPICTRNLLYFASRYAILFDPVTITQQFYTGHKKKVTAIASHPTMELIASSEESFVHIWKVRERVAINKIKTTLKSVFLLRFGNSKQGGEVLAVVGMNEQLPGVQLYNWLYETLMASIVLYSELQDLQFHPTDLYMFSLCGHQHFSIWKRSGRLLKCKCEVKLQKTLKVMRYLTFKLRKDADLLIGTANGELLISVEGRLLVHVENAHEGAVLAISTADYQSLSLVFTGGQDGFVKIWSHSLMPLNKFHISSIPDPIIVHSKMHQVVNIQVYICASRKPLDSILPKGAKTDPLVLAISTSAGGLLEVSLSNISFSEQIVLQFKVYSESHAQDSQQLAKTLFTLHPEVAIMASIGEDKTLKIWQYDNSVCLTSKELDNNTRPCAIEFSYSGLLAIGMENGVVILLSCRDYSWGYGGKPESDISVFSTLRETNAAVICIAFSHDSEYMAISYNNVKGVSRFGESSGLKTGSNDVTTGFVALYQQQDSGAYKKCAKISFPFGTVKDIASYPPRSNCAVAFIEFSEDNLFIAMIHQRIRTDLLPDQYDYKPLLVIWDIVSAGMIDNFENVANVIWTNTIVNALLFSAVRTNGVNIASNVYVQDKHCFFIGDFQGFLYVTRVASISAAYTSRVKSSKNAGFDVISNSRKLLAHTDQVICSKYNEILLTSAFDENCIMQWKTVPEEASWELDYTDASTSSDPFSETLNLDQFTKILAETWMPQSELIIKTDKNIELKIENAIGRRARDRRNNLEFDAEDRILYCTGNNIVLLSKENNTQVFLQYSNKNLKINLSEISSFCISGDKRSVFLGTCDLQCRIMLWDLYAYAMIFSLPLHDACVVQSLKISPSNRYLICVATSKSYQQLLFLIEITSNYTPIIISSVPILSECVYKIKDICITEYNGLEIYTSGVQHFMKWKVNSSILHYYSIPLPEETPLCILCVTSVKSVIITTADDGKIYIWHNDALFRSVPGHDGCILSLKINEELGILITGGVDGHVIVWKLSVSDYTESLEVSLDSLREYSLQDSSAHELAYAVQSLSLGSYIPDEGFKVLIGTQNGSIYELSYETNADLDTLSKVSVAIDSQSILSISCDTTSTYLFTLSANGIFSIWGIKSFSQFYSFDFNRPSVKLAVFQHKSFDDEELGATQHYVIIGFETEVLLVQVTENDGFEHEVLSEFSIDVTGLTDLKLSNDEKFLALASSSEQKPHVDIYIVKKTELIIDKNLYGFRASVIRLDFSTDGYYLMCEDNLGEVLLFELETQNIASFHSVEFEIEWLNEGLRHSTGLKSIHQLYNINNKIACICKSPSLNILAIGDEYGVIALYQLPYIPGSSLIMIPGHSYKMSIIMFTPDDKYLITYSELDRSIIKWRIGEKGVIS